MKTDEDVMLAERFTAIADATDDGDWDDVVRRRAASTARSGRRSRSMRLSALFAAAAVAVAVALIAPWKSSSGSLSDRALAAIGTQPVLHVVAELPAQSQLIDLKTGMATPLKEEREIWYDGGRGIEHTIDRLGGAVVWDRLETPQGEITAAGPATFPRSKPTIEPALEGFVDGYRQALASGAARETGRGTLDGVPVVWLSFALPGGDREEVAVAVDSGRPLLVKMCSGPCWTYRIKTIETLSLDVANFRRPTESKTAKDAASGVKNDRNVVSVDVGSLPDAVPGAVWPGSSVEGVALASATRENYHTTFGDGATEDWSGVQLLYGATSSLGVPDWKQPFVQLWESAQPQSAYLGPRGPQLPASQLDGRLYVPWRGPAPPSAPATAPFDVPTGLTVVNGVYVAVRASSGELLLAAARALRPIG
jgi:hypothetical protein